MKKCTKCGETKPLDEFSRDKGKRDGRESRCRSCKARDNAGWRAVNPEYHAEYRAENRESRRRYDAVYRDRHSDRIAIRHARYYADNRERLADQQAKYRDENPHREWVKTYRKSALRLGIPFAAIEHFTLADVIDRYGDGCFYCETGEFEQLDHAIPVSKSGPHTLDNVRPSCAFCNNSKHDMTADEFIAAKAGIFPGPDPA